MSDDHSTLADSLRDIIEDARSAGWSLNALATELGIPQPNLHNFLKGNRSLSLGSAQIIANWAGVRLTKPRRLPRPPSGS